MASKGFPEAKTKYLNMAKYRTPGQTPVSIRVTLALRVEWKVLPPNFRTRGVPCWYASMLWMVTEFDKFCGRCMSSARTGRAVP